MDTFTLDLGSVVQLTDEQFFQLCQIHHDYRFERTPKGELIIMSLAGGETSSRNASLTAQLWVWNAQAKLGKVFDSSGGFKLPNGADRSPDAAWVKQERWQALTPEQRQKFPPLCPDFVVELRSPSDSLKTIREKMQEYLDNGAQLGWLIDPEMNQVEVYRPNRTVEVLRSPKTLAGEEVLPGFVLDVEAVLTADN
jgi:Uma2 family endonuclease